MSGQPLLPPPPQPTAGPGPNDNDVSVQCTYFYPTAIPHRLRERCGNMVQRIYAGTPPLCHLHRGKVDGWKKPPPPPKQGKGRGNGKKGRGGGRGGEDWKRQIGARQSICSRNCAK